MMDSRPVPRPNSIDLLWLSFVLFILLSVAFLLPIVPQDYWWVMRLGQDVIRNGSVPTVDLYSFSRMNVPFFHQSWLAGVAFWAVYGLGGLIPTFLLRAFLLAAAYVLLWNLMRASGLDTRLTALLLLFAALAGSNNWSFRPQLFSYPLFVLALSVLWNWHQGRRTALWLLPLISILWVNLHGSFPLLFVLCAIFFLFGRGNKKQLSLFAGLALLGILLNPQGVRVMGYVGNMLASPSNQRYSVEWLPMVNRGWQANLFYFWLLIFAPLAVLSSRKLSRLEWALFLLFGWLALYGERYVIWFTFILAFESARLLSGFEFQILAGQTQHEERPRLNLLMASLLLLIPLALLPGVREAWWRKAPSPYTPANPIHAAAWLAEHPELPGPLFSEYSASSYLIFALPARPVWIDTRFELYPPSMWDEYSAVSSAAPAWQSILEREGIQLLLLSTHTQPNLILAVGNSQAWCEQYQDDDFVIFSLKGNSPCQ